MRIVNYTSIFLIAFILSTSYLLSYTPLIIAIFYILFGLLTYFIYARDKHAAQNGSWRISENTLHTFSLLCGWPGAIIAQQTLRHKTKKISFQIIFWFTVLFNSGVLAWLHTTEGSVSLHSCTEKAEEIITNEMSISKTRSALLTALSFRENL